MTHSAQAALRGEPSYVWRSGQDRRLEMIQQWVELDGATLLDAGCGLGTYLQALTPFSAQRYGLEVELERAVQAIPTANGIMQGVGEFLPFADGQFDFVLSNEVIEHVNDDFYYARELVRVTKSGGRIIIFCPNRWYPVEQHGIFWQGNYHFGNIPLVNYLPMGVRNQLAPHVRTYTEADLLLRFEKLPVQVLHHTQIYGGYDNIERRWPTVGKWIKKVLYTAEKTPLKTLGLSHLLVLQKQ